MHDARRPFPFALERYSVYRGTGFFFCTTSVVRCFNEGFLVKRIFLPLPLLVLFLHLTVVPGWAADTKGTLNFVVNIDEATIVDRVLYYALQRAGYSLSMDAAPMTYAIQMADSGERAGLASQVRGLEERFPNLVMVPEQLLDVSFPAFVRKDSPLRFTSWADLSGLRVGHLFQKTYIMNRLPKDIAGSIQRETFRELNLALEQGECDVIITSATFTVAPIISKNIKPAGLVETMPSYTYVHKRHAGLVPAIAASLRGMKADGTYGKIVRGAPLQADAQERILHVSSSHPDDPWERRIRAGMEAVLGQDRNIAYYNVPLYSNRFQTDHERAKNAYYFVRTMFLANPPDVIVVSDSNALTFVCNYYNSLFSGIPVVFCGISGAPEGIWQLGDNHTGVWARPSAGETLAHALKMFPATRSVFVVNDHTESGKAWRAAIERDLAVSAGNFAVAYSANVPYRDLLATLAELPADSVVLWGNYSTDSAGLYFSPAEIQRQVRAHTAAPVFGLMEGGLGHGQIGGKYVDPEMQGKLAAGMALAALAGNRVADMAPVRDTAKYNRWLFDAMALDRLPPPARVVPAGAEYVNRRLNLYESNPQAFYLFLALSFLALCVILCLFVFTMAMRRKNARLLEMQKNLHTAEEMLSKDMEVIAAKERLDVALASSQAGVWEFVMGENIFRFDQGTADLLQLREPSPISIRRCVRHLRDIMPDYRDLAHFNDLFRRHAIKARVIENVRIVREDGTERFLNTYAKTVSDGAGKPLRTVGMSMDVTQRVKMAEELRAAKEAADAANRAKSRFLANMSHEIRTPMNAVLGMLKIAKNSGEADKIKKCLATAETASNHLLDIINDILDISKIESGKIELFAEPFDLERMLQDVMHVVAVRAEEKRQEVLLRRAENIPAHLHGDSMRLAQVIINLLSNAVKFSQEDAKIRMTLSCPEQDGQRVLLAVSVADQGIGLTEEQIAGLFQAFQQADNSITKRFGGTGLGLAIAKKIVNMMGGDIAVTSRPGEGSTFSFTVRLGVAAGAPSRDRGAEIDTDRVNALVVDDDAETRASLCGMLRALGIRHVAADGYEEAARIVGSRNGAAVNLILMDHRMPDLDGIEAARRLHEGGWARRPVILMGMQQSALAWDEAKAAGIDFFLAKPVFPSTLLAAVGDALGAVRPAEQEQEAAVPDYCGKRILLVEDIEINREIIKALLAPSGAAITEVENGREAVDAFEARPDDFDLILMDVQMPVMDGYAASRAIRASRFSQGALIPILAMTANAFREDVDDAMQAKMDGHLSKPVDEAKLYAELSRYLLGGKGAGFP